jgi:5-methylcytosine-specific restriction endonuclease McrA
MSHTKYSDKDSQNIVWGYAKTILGLDPKKYRLDPYGTKICYTSYGKTSDMGWQIDHITPLNRGGSNDIRNLQALHWFVNQSKGDSLVKRSRHSKRNQ